MLPYAYYLLKVIICSAVLTGYYWLALRNKIFHGYNRFYLLATVVLALTLPLIKINFWTGNSDQTGVVSVLQTVSSGDEYLENVFITSSSKSHAAAFDTQQLYSFIYLAVSLVMFFIFIYALLSIVWMLKKYPVKKVDSISFINTEAKGTPFSFLRYIFWNSNIDMDTTAGKHIFKHEVAHIQEKHTHDKLFINTILIFFWCNPLFWIIRKELNMIHEFIADKKAVEDSDTSAFAAMILQAAYPQHRFQLANNFFYSPIKRRLLMLTKNKNPRVGYIGRILVLPLAVLVFAAFTLKKEKTSGPYNGEKVTIVIDAGHGGKDGGARSSDGLLEKDVALAIAQKIKALNSNVNIDILLVRNDDSYLSPVDKINFARNNNAKLFISLHCDGQPDNAVSRSSGLSICVPKDDNLLLDASKQFGSAIINNFKADYGIPVNENLIQLNQGIWILKKNPCPAILIETGFITTPSDAAYISSAKGQEKIAQNILKGIEQYLLSDRSSESVTITPATMDTVPPQTVIEMRSDKTAARIKAQNLLKLKTTEKNPPLYFLDGKEITTTILEDLSPNTINAINVLKGDQAIKKYGERAKYGAIVIETKKIVDGVEEVVVQGYQQKQKATIYLDKMNDLYIGVDNLITVSTEINTQDLGISISQGSVTGTDGKYIVRVNSIGNAAITITNKKTGETLGKQIFYVKRIPDPSLTIAGMEATDTKNNIEEVIVEGKKVEERKAAANELNEVTVQGRPAAGRAIAVEGKKIEETKRLQGVVVERTVTGYPSRSDDIIFTKVEIDPMFPGGKDGWKNFLMKNLNPGVPVAEGWSAGTYTVIVNFIVKKDGSISDVTTVNYKGTKTAAECIRVITNGPKWLPAIQNGKKVNAYRKQPITFFIEEGETPKKPVTQTGPTFNMGNFSSYKVDSDKFKKETQINVSDNATFSSATVYFSGAGFPFVVSIQLSGNNLEGYKKYLAQCGPGSNITFDNVRIINNRGLMTIAGKTYSML